MRLLVLLFLLPLALVAQTRPKVLVVTPNAVVLNSHTVRALSVNKMMADSFVAKARQIFVRYAKPDLSDYTVHVLGIDDTQSLKPTLVERSATIKVKKKNFLTKKEHIKNKKVRYKGVQIGPDEKLTLDAIAQTFSYDYIVFISLFEIHNEKMPNLAFKPLSLFSVHYEVYDKNQVFKTGNSITDAFTISPGMDPKVLFHYLNLSAENVFHAVAPLLSN